MQFSRNWMSSRLYWFPAWNDKASLDIQRYGCCSAPVVVGHEWEFATLSRIKTNRGAPPYHFHSCESYYPFRARSRPLSSFVTKLRILFSWLRVRWQQMSADLSSARLAMPVSTLISKSKQIIFLLLQTICWTEWTEWHQFGWPQ